jgi:hypothetical protein
MNNKELQAARKILFLEVAEAAEHIGGVPARSWRRWEDGTHRVPSDVENKIQELAEKRLNMIDSIDALIEEQQSDELDIAFYASHDEYKADNPGATVLDWRLSQSVAAYYFLEGSAKLI